MTPNALGGERDGSQRIFDLVGDTTRDLAPCRLLLCGEQIGKVFEDDHVAEPLLLVFQRGDCYRKCQLAAANDDLRLAGYRSHAVCLADQVIEILDHVGWEQLLQRSSCGEARQRLRTPRAAVVRGE